MTMQFRVVHTTRIAYDGGVAASYNEARMTPITTAEQVVVHTRLDVAPTPTEQVWTIGADFYVTPNIVFKADYQQFRIDSTRNAFQVGFGLNF